MRSRSDGRASIHVGHAIIVPHVQLNSGYLFLLIATAGTTITPFMQLYVQSAVVEKESGRPN